MDLIVDNLTCSRGGIAILSGVNFTLKSGRALILRGPNGSGKTTLLRTIAGLQPALVGAVQTGEDAIAYAGHTDGLKSTLTVADNLKFWAGIYGTGTIEHALTAFDLLSLVQRPAQNLSAGQKRRLGLARLLVTGRPVWVLDEPTVSLDAASVAQFARAVEHHLSAGGSALIATHIDLALKADTLDVARFSAAAAPPSSAFDRAFL